MAATARRCLGSAPAVRPRRLAAAALGRSRPWRPPRLRPRSSAACRFGRPARHGSAGSDLGRLTSTPPLVDQRRQPIGEASRQRLKQAGELPHRGSDRAGELGEQTLHGKEGRRGRSHRGVEQLGAEQPALHDELRVHAAEVPEHLRDRPDVVANEDDRRRALQVLVQSCLVGVRGRTAHQGVLEDLVVRTRGAQLAAQGCQVAHLEAAVLGEDRRARAAEMLAHLLNDGDLLRSRSCHERSFDHMPRGRPRDKAPEGSRRAGRGSAWHFASSGGSETLSAPFGAPEIYGELFSW